MIVADSNVLAYFYIESVHTAAATALHASDPQWAVPPLWRSEFRNILAGYMRRGTMSIAQAHARVVAAEQFLGQHEYPVDSLSVLQLVDKSACSAYDCEFVALAIKLKTKLVTLDAKVLRAFPKHTVALGAA